VKKLLTIILLFVLFDYAGAFKKPCLSNSPAVKQTAFLSSSVIHSRAGLNFVIPVSNAGSYSTGFQKVLELSGHAKAQSGPSFAYHNSLQQIYRFSLSSEYLSHIYPSHHFW
jgi:hypothetical protein